MRTASWLKPVVKRQLSKVFFGPRGGGENSLPAYALYIKGIGAPVFYKGGWSEKSIGKWLRTQTEMQPAEVNSAAALRAAVDANAHGLALVGFLTESQRSRRLGRRPLHLNEKRRIPRALPLQELAG